MNKFIVDLQDLICCDQETVEIYIKILEQPRNDKFFSPEELAKIETLRSLCLVSDYIDRHRVKYYFPVDPQFSLSAIILNEMWSTQSDLHTIDDLLNNPQLSKLHLRHRLCEGILKIARKMYHKNLPFLKENAVVIRGHKRIASCLSELLEMAEKDVYAIISPPHLLGEIIWQTISEKMRSGIHYHRITTFSELVRHGYVIYRNEIKNNNESLYIHKNLVLPQKFYIINDITVIFFIPDKKNENFKFEVQIINNKSIAEQYLGVYKKSQQESIDLSKIIDAISLFRDDYLAKARKLISDEEFLWLTDVFDYGIFIQKDKHSETIAEKAKKKCRSLRLIEIAQNAEVFANYTLEEILHYVR